jgi:filamin/ABP280 repeat protein/Big-like domain-containing protein/invasin-like protein
VVRGDGQIGTVGQPLGDSLVVRVTDPENRPVEGVEVAFVPPAGATLSPNDTVLTGGDGQAAVFYTLSTTAGDQMVEARARPVVASAALDTVFHAVARPEAATSLVLIDGDEQIGETASPLPDSLAVRALDRFGNGVAGIEVTWDATGGAVNPASVVTGADGRAATERILGDRPGQYPTTASAGDLEGSPISFTATGVVPPSPQLILITQPSPSASAGVPFGRQPVLQLQDAVGAPLHRADVAVTVQIASGGPSLGGEVTVNSNAEGLVTFNDLSVRGVPGARTLIFAANDFTSAISTPIEVGPGPARASTSSASVPNGTAGASTTITIRLRDEFGTPVEGAAGEILVSVEGANPASSLAVTDLGAGSYSASYVPTHTGSDQVGVQVNGSAVAGSPLISTVAPGPADASTTTAVVTRAGFFTVNALVTARDAQGNLLGRGGDRVQMQLNGGALEDATDNGDGTYSKSFFPVFGFSIDITLNGVPIAGSPYTTTTQ